MEMVGFAASSLMRISPTRLFQVRSLFRTICPSRPGIGERIVPWFNAARRPGVRFLSVSTSGTSAARRSVLSKRSSLLALQTLRQLWIGVGVRQVVFQVHLVLFLGIGRSLL